MPERKPPRNHTSAPTSAEQSSKNFNSAATAVVIGVLLVHAVMGGKDNRAIIALADAALAAVILVAIIRAIRAKRSPKPIVEPILTSGDRKKNKKSGLPMNHRR